VIESSAEFLRLVESSDPADRKRAAWEPAPDAVWHEVLENHPDMHFSVAHNRTVPESILILLVNAEDWRVRDRIAAKNACSPLLLEMLSHDPHDAVAATVAAHPRTPESALRRLADHSWSKVRDRARARLAD
jgi:hypothetical protein